MIFFRKLLVFHLHKTDVKIYVESFFFLYFTPPSSLSIDDFEQVNASWMQTFFFNPFQINVPLSQNIRKSED